MTLRLKYENIKLTKRRKNGKYTRTKKGVRVLKHIGECQEQGGYVKFLTIYNRKGEEILVEASLEWFK